MKVLDVNEPPSFVEVTEIHVPEDRKVGEVIGTVTVEDADLKEQLSFTVTRGYTDFMITNTSCFTEVRLANTHLGLKKIIPFHSQLHFVFTYLSNYLLDMFLKCNGFLNTQVSSKCHAPLFFSSVRTRNSVRGEPRPEAPPGLRGCIYPPPDCVCTGLRGPYSHPQSDDQRGRYQ